MPSGVETILLVEDDKSLLEIGTTMLESFGYDVIATSSPNEAISLFEKNKEKIALLITDVIMPEMNGKQLVERIFKINDGIKVLFISGYTSDVIEKNDLERDGTNFIQKPFSLTELLKKVRTLIDVKL